MQTIGMVPIEWIRENGLFSSNGAMRRAYLAHLGAKGHKEDLMWRKRWSLRRNPGPSHTRPRNGRRGLRGIMMSQTEIILARAQHR